MHGVPSGSGKHLSSPAKIAAVAADSGIPREYLVILRREIGSLQPKPVPLARFPGIDPALISKLAGAGLKTSKAYWEDRRTASDELFCLCDLVRVNGVGPVAAKTFYEAGYRSVSDVVGANAAVMLQKVCAVNATRQYYKMKLGVKDMQFCIDFASLLAEYAA